MMRWCMAERRRQRSRALTHGQVLNVLPRRCCFSSGSPAPERTANSNVFDGGPSLQALINGG
jgi:hypothetical protein